ncbi:MAG: flippase-like domain-containing protein [Saprospiraceae bacterium]|nr:flippase-like domain-containing protein [Saprospiraceae bacterium]
MNHKYARWIFIILSLSFILKFYADENFWRSINDFPALNSWSLPLFCIIILLIPFNWFLEGLKWRVFLSNDKKPSYPVMLKIIFAGVSCAILTPNRMGDFIGRGLVSPTEMREETVLATFMGNFCQFFILLLFGIPALVFLFPLLANHSTQQTHFPMVAVVFWLILCFVFLLVYRPIFKFFARLSKRWPWTTSWEEKFLSLSNITYATFFKGLFYAGVRYLVFSFQYYLVLNLWGVHLPLFPMYVGLAGLYLFQTIIPLPPLYSLIVRGETSVLVWGIWGVAPITAMTASYMLFIFNLFVPAVIGFFILLPIRPSKN